MRGTGLAIYYDTLENYDLQVEELNKQKTKFHAYSVLAEEEPAQSLENCRQVHMPKKSQTTIRRKESLQ